MQAINRTAIFIILLIYLAIGMHIFIPGMGGSGLRMPGNIVAWVFIALSVLAYWLLNSHRNITITTTFKLIFAGVVFLLIPLLYTPEKWLRDALFQMAGVMAGLAFYFTLLQCRFSECWRVRIINLLLFAVLIQGGIGFIQLSLLPPDSGLMALSAQ
jgi:O-antigen polymerase